ncbi:MAG TPA: phosphoenolpyruvate carboxykinase (ATP), partial [Sulfurospirillum sp. UBA11407]
MSSIKEIDKLGLSNIGKIFYNLSYEELYEHEVKNNEGVTTANGTFAVDTGIFTGRSPKDKYFVKQDPSQKYIAWGNINQPISKEIFDDLFAQARTQLSNKDLYIQDAYCGGSL